MRTGYKVIDAMTTRPYTADPAITLREAAKLMRDHGVGSLLLKKGDALVGIVTEWDLVRRGMALGLDTEKTKIEKVMTPAAEMAAIDPGMDVFDALNLMRERDIRHLPVLDGKRLAGFLTMKDVLKLQPQLFELIAEKYDVREEGRKRGFLHGDCDVCKEFSDRLREVRGLKACPSCLEDV